MTTYCTINRACKSWTTLAFIDHPNNSGWSIRFAHEKSQFGDYMLGIEYVDTKGEVVSFDVIDRHDRRCHADMALSGRWDVTLYLVGRYCLSPNAYAWDVARVIETLAPVQTRNALRPTER